MIRIYVLVEGQCEQVFLSILEKYLARFNIFLNTNIIETRRDSKKGRRFQGGVSSYAKLKKQIEIKCKEDPRAFVTTMFDLYKFPKDAPWSNEAILIKDPLKRALYVEEKIDKDIGHRKFFSYVNVHEFEALLLSHPIYFSRCCPDKGSVEKLIKIAGNYSSPELINGDLPPSKLIENTIPGYRKVAHGKSIAEAIGLDKILEKCPHFRAWYNKICNLQ
jgi:hypothetical protein